LIRVLFYPISFIPCISGLPRGEPCEGCVSQARTRRPVTVLALVPDNDTNGYIALHQHCKWNSWFGRQAKEVYRNMTDQTQSESPSRAVDKIEEQPVSPTAARHSSEQFARDALLLPDGKQYVSISSSQPEATKETDADADEPIHKGIYWWSPIAMVSFFLLGVLTSFMHHFYYTVLDERQVGNDRQQQWALRFESPSYLAVFID
jgi:hypothetical protein